MGLFGIEIRKRFIDCILDFGRGGSNMHKMTDSNKLKRCFVVI